MEGDRTMSDDEAIRLANGFNSTDYYWARSYYSSVTRTLALAALSTSGPFEVHPRLVLGRLLFVHPSYVKMPYTLHSVHFAKIENGVIAIASGGRLFQIRCEKILFYPAASREGAKK